MRSWIIESFTVECTGTGVYAPDNAGGGYHPYSEEQRWFTASAVDMRKRIGRFYIAAEMMEDDLAAVCALMAEVIVVDARHDWAQRRFEFIVMSERLPEAPLGQLIMAYVPVFERREDGAVRFVRFE